MKHFYFACLSLIMALPGMAQKLEAGASYSVSFPQKEMAKNIQALHSVNGSFSYSPKGELSRLAIGTELSIGFYAYVTKNQDLRFPDGSGINTNITYSSNVFSGGLTARVSAFKEATFNPYINIKGGYTRFFSNVMVGDPNDDDACKPLEKRNIIGDHTMYWTYGGGFQLDMAVFSKKQKKGEAMLDFSINQVRGGNLDYINTKHIQEHVHTDPNNPNPNPNPGPVKATPLTVRFVNVNTQIVHEHQVAEIYNSPLRMLDFKLGVKFRLNANKS